MEDQLAREVRLAPPEEPSQSDLRHDLVGISEEASLRPEVQALMQRCMDGSEPLPPGVERKKWEQQKFNPQNIQVVLLRAAGFKQVEIAEILGIDQARVSVTMRHPYGRKILHALLPQQTARVIDIRTKLEEQSSALMDHAFKLAITSEDIKEVREVTFGFLDRAGYNPVNKTQAAIGTPKDFMEAASSKDLRRLSDALDESNRVSSEIMPNWTAPLPPEDAASVSGFATFEELSAAEDSSAETHKE